MLLKQLEETKDDAVTANLLAILQPLSIVDSRSQALFRQEEAIHYLLKILDSNKET